MPLSTVVSGSGIVTTIAQAITPSLPVNSDNFGCGIAASDDYMIVGAPGSSKVFIFERDGGGVWVEVAAFSYTTAWSAGSSVDLKGDLAVAGAANEDEGGGSDVGTVYVYRRVAGTWTQIQQILFPFAVSRTNYHFGRCVALSGDASVLVIGQPDSGSSGVGGRYSYVYRWNTGTLQYDYETQIGPGSSVDCGCSIAVSEDSNRVVLGCRRNSSSRGLVQVYEYDTNGILNGGVPAVVAGSQIDTTTGSPPPGGPATNPLIPSAYEIDVAAAFAGYTGKGVFECRFRINVADAVNVASCQSADLLFETS